MTTSQKKVVKKTVIIDGKEVPYYICPPGMSGLGLDIEKSLAQEEKEEAIFEPIEDIAALEAALKEDCGFLKAHQRYLEEGETDNQAVEDYLAYKQSNKYYDAEYDRNVDLVTIFNR